MVSDLTKCAMSVTLQINNFNNNRIHELSQCMDRHVKPDLHVGYQRVDST